LAVQIAAELKVVGLLNIQFAIDGNEIYILEVNPRVSRTVSSEKDPYYKLGYNNRGNVYFVQKNYKRAVQQYSEALSIDDSYMKAYYNCALAFIQMGKFDRAIEDLTSAIDIDPTFHDLYVKRAEAYAELGNHFASLKDKLTKLKLQ